MATLRTTSTRRDVKAGCYDCSGGDVKWQGGQAQGTAARHHDSTGHATWVEVYMAVYYGTESGKKNDNAASR